MAEVINMPRLSDTMEEGTVAKWLKNVGDKIEEGDILAEIETDNEVILTQDALLAEAQKSSIFSLFMPGGHYSPRGNEVIAEIIAQYICGTNN